MKIIILIVLVIAQSLSYAAEPTASEIEVVDKMFVKVRYILGAAFDAHNLKFIEPEKYGNIPAFISMTESLKQDAIIFQKKLNSLSSQKYGHLFLTLAIREIVLCVSNLSGSSYCAQALSTLKDFYWEKKFGITWSGHPILTIWEGFPDSMK